ncbi:flagellar hook-length control protein FliK [Candidatus Halocynthiibacter alkanivorans]|uniref:flagellar hook-length control protein FliK n=1 Tax=Candidatus Halocynthiibacter alkanivorans TaxID=2267619 RepID=UPI000DF19CB5|nr:flagellar hook-length control protein FliK [Candidatus Halocynthiibacter alkanivorans]
MQIQNVFAAIGGTSDTELPPQVGSDGESGFAAFVDAQAQLPSRNSAKPNIPNKISENRASSGPVDAGVPDDGEPFQRSGGSLSESADATGGPVKLSSGDDRDLLETAAGGRGESLFVPTPQNAPGLTMAQSLFQTAGDTVRGPNGEIATPVQAVQAGEYITPEEMAELSMTPEVLAALSRAAQPVTRQTGSVEAPLGTAADQVVSGSAVSFAAQAGVPDAAETGLTQATVAVSANLNRRQAADQVNLNRTQTADPAPLSPPGETSVLSAVQLAVEAVMGGRGQAGDSRVPGSAEPAQTPIQQSQPQMRFASGDLSVGLPASQAGSPSQTAFSVRAEPAQSAQLPQTPDTDPVPESGVAGLEKQTSMASPKQSSPAAQVQTLPDSQAQTAPLRAETQPVTVAQASQAATQIAIPVQNQGKTPADVLRPGARTAETEQRPPNRRSVDAAGTPAPENPAYPATPVKAGAPLTASALKPVQTAQAGPLLQDPQPVLNESGSPVRIGNQGFDIRDPETVSAAPAATGEASAPAQAVTQAAAGLVPMSLAELALEAAPDVVAAEISTEMSSARVETAAQLQQQRTDLPARIAAQLAQAAQTMPDAPIELALNPEELGNVRLTFIASEGAMNVVVAAERGETLDLMRRNIDTLAAEFREMGFKDVSFSFSQQGGQNFDDGEPGQSGNQSQIASEHQDLPADTPDPVRIALDGSGGVDLRL